MLTDRTWIRRALVLLPVALLLTGCWDAAEFPMTTTDSSTDFNDAILALYERITWITMVVWVLVFALLGYVLFRFRDDGKPGNPEQIHGNTQLEVGWTLIPIVLVLVMIVPTIRTIFQIADAAPEDAVEIRVIGKRWWWEFEYVDSGIVTANEVHVPAGRPVSFLIESDTVIHSFWVPRLGGKRDAVPGRINRIWFTIKDQVLPGQPETYLGHCAEYCGEAHALMKMRVIAHDPAEFDQWLVDMASPPAPPAAVASKGEDAFTKGGCIACHTVRGFDMANGRVGPDLTDFGTRATIGAGAAENTPENLALWLQDVNNLKPGTRGRFDGMNVPVELTDDQVQDLVAYLQALDLE